MTTHIRVPVSYTADGHEVLAAAAARLTFGDGPATLAGAILRRLAEKLDSDHPRDREDGWEALRLLGLTQPVGDDDFAGRLARLRTAAGLSVPDLARKSGLSDDVLRRYEDGTRSPTWDSVQKLAAALGVPTDTFRTA